MTDGPATEGDGIQVETSRQGPPDPATTMCHFNQKCAKADCPYAHSSPAAPKTAVVDMNTTCDFGAACKNFKCVGKHPSPAKKQQFQAEQECIYFPNCRDPSTCPYKHPVEKPCRNGADSRLHILAQLCCLQVQPVHECSLYIQASSGRSEVGQEEQRLDRLKERRRAEEGTCQREEIH
jgi:hypothetical protein